VKAGLQRPDVKFGEKRSGDIVRNVSDVSRAKDILNWHAKTSFDKGIAKTVKWFLDQQE
jgi:UDP-glucose 4-epimerase